MRTRSKVLVGFLLSLVCAAVAGVAWGGWPASPTYRVVDVGPYPLPSYSGPTSEMPPDPSQQAGYDKASENHALTRWFAAGHMKNLKTLMQRRSHQSSAFVAVGNSMMADGTCHAYSYRKQKVTDLGTLPGDNDSIALSLNNRGEAVGVSGRRLAADVFAPGAVGYESPHPFLFSDGKMVDLSRLIPPSSGWTLQQADRINDLGQIMGYGQYDGQTRTFLLTPKQFIRKP